MYSRLIRTLSVHLFELYILFAISWMVDPVLSLYEDQIGKFDWKQSYVGKVKFAEFDKIFPVKRLFISSDENVIAAINIKTGQIIWRQVLEKADDGAVHFMDVTSDAIVTVSGISKTLVRGWDLNSGHLIWEWTMPQQLGSSNFAKLKWLICSGNLCVTHLGEGQITISKYKLASGSKVGQNKIIPALFLSSPRCAVVKTLIGCLKASTVHFVDICDNEPKIWSQDLSEFLGGKEPNDLLVLPGSKQIVAINLNGKQIPFVVENENLRHIPVMSSPPARLVQVSDSDENFLLHVDLKGEILEISATKISNGELVDDLTTSMKYPQNMGQPYLTTATCSPRKDKGLGCRIVFATEDHGIMLLVHPVGKVAWVREEALASIVAVEMLDLPVSDTDAAIEKEFDHKETGFLGMFMHRLISQILQLRSLFLTVFGFGEPPSAGQRAGLVRDEFGLHKMIVVATSVGKVYGIDNLNGEIIWQVWLPDITSYYSDMLDKLHMALFVQRTTRHFPHPAQCALLAKHKVTGEGIIFTFNPFSGLGDIERLGYRVKQVTLLHQPDAQFLRGLLLLDQYGNLHVHPASTESVAKAIAKKTFIYTANEETGHLIGYSVNQELMSSPLWEVKLGSRITAVVGKNPIERVHSQGRVLADRSVLYKYVNPNLVVVATQGDDIANKQLLNLFLLDAVSGSVVFSTTHRRVKDPVHIVHSENWVVYSYYSDRFRRTEVVTLELYEGKVQSNTTAFSSMGAAIQPIVDRQAYILPSNVEAMKETITEKGITSKHILVALASGSILELPWLFVDPRRPLTVTPEMREEGVIPYAPELPILADAIINYNQTLQKVKGIHTFPSGLESTCLIFVHGLDLFYTRVTPSKTFDVLKEDFDHFLITAVLIGLTSASYITKKLASRKALKQAWK